METWQLAVLGGMLAAIVVAVLDIAKLLREIRDGLNRVQEKLDAIARVTTRVGVRMSEEESSENTAKLKRLAEEAVRGVARERGGN